MLSGMAQLAIPSGGETEAVNSSSRSEDDLLRLWSHNQVFPFQVL